MRGWCRCICDACRHSSHTFANPRVLACKGRPCSRAPLLKPPLANCYCVPCTCQQFALRQRAATCSAVTLCRSPSSPHLPVSGIPPCKPPGWTDLPLSRITLPGTWAAVQKLSASIEVLHVNGREGTTSKCMSQCLPQPALITAPTARSHYTHAGAHDAGMNSDFMTVGSSLTSTQSECRRAIYLRNRTGAKGRGSKLAPCFHRTRMPSSQPLIRGITRVHGLSGVTRTSDKPPPVVLLLARP